MPIVVETLTEGVNRAVKGGYGIRPGEGDLIWWGFAGPHMLVTSGGSTRMDWPNGPQPKVRNESAAAAQEEDVDAALIILLVLIGLIALVLLMGFGVYNGLVRARQRVQEAWSGIDVQLKRRASLVPNLVETVKGYAAHERRLFEEVTKARAHGIEAGDVPEQAQAETEITRGLRQLFAVAENYPDLKANQNFLALQEELTGTESKIAFARQFYNDQVLRYNTLIQQFPSMIVARLTRHTPRDFFEIEETSRGPVGVDLS
jgi:LemA protein